MDDPLSERLDLISFKKPGVCILPLYQTIFRIFLFKFQVHYFYVLDSLDVS